MNKSKWFDTLKLPAICSYLRNHEVLNCNDAINNNHPITAHTHLMTIKDALEFLEKQLRERKIE